MKKINESMQNAGGANMTNRGDFTRGIPFYGPKGDFNFSLGRSRFTPGISIKQVPFTDMSHNGDIGFSEFDRELSRIKHFFKPGDRIRGTLVNSQLESEVGKTIVGKLDRIFADHSTNSIRAYIKNPKNLKIQEVYIESIERLHESYCRALTFDQFIGS